jgi:UDP-N-acetyl-D-glucosamine dehydrogenase
LNDAGKPVKGSKIVIYGVAYKRDIDDVRESPALDIMHLLSKRGAEISYVDPYVPQVRFDSEIVLASDDDVVKTADCVVIVTDHKSFDYEALLADAHLIVDTRNALKGVVSEKVYRL